MDEITAMAAALRDALATHGEADAALRLNDVLTSYWTTSSEALVELLNALDEIREAWERRLSPSNAALGDAIVSSARDLLNFV